MSVCCPPGARVLSGCAWGRLEKELGKEVLLAEFELALLLVAFLSKDPFQLFTRR